MNIPRFGVRNPVAVNLLMWFLLVAGGFTWFSLVRELFPNFEPEQVVITVPYPGATPEEVEKSVTLRIEREIEGVNGIDEIASQILEGVTAVRVTLDQDADRDRVLNELRNEIDRVTPELPEGAEEPEVVALRPYFPVISVMVYGDVAEERLREAAEDVRDELLDLPGISEVTVSGIRDREIWAEIDPEKLEEEQLTFEEVGRAVAAGNLDLPGGQLESARGNVRVRTLGEEDSGAAIERLVIRADTDGTSIRLRDVARVRETFEDEIKRGRFNGLPAATITVFKTPEQDAIEIAEQVKGYVAESPTLYDGAISLSTMSDLSRFVVDRLDLMIRNARMGLILVCIALALFLDLRVAFWVAVGLPIAFMGTFILMMIMGVSINLISLFGLIVVLGLIVDDAIVIGENVFTKMREGLSPARAAIVGTGEMILPVTAAVLTTVFAFGPLAFLEGRLGVWLGQLPYVVIAALAVSLVEAFLILPAHLGHTRIRAQGEDFKKTQRAMIRWWQGMQRARHRLIERKLTAVLERHVRRALHWRYPVMAAMVASLLLAAGLVRGGVVPFVLLQNVDAENVQVELEMAAGTPVDRTEEVLADLERVILEQEEVAIVYTVVGASFSERGRESAADPATVGQLNLELHPADLRQDRGLRTSAAMINELRERTRDIPGVNKLTYNERAGGPQGADIEIRVRGEDIAVLEGAVNHVRDTLGTYDGVFEIEDDLNTGKLEARLRLRDDARGLGIDTRTLALQMRHALFGYEAQELQEEDGEVTVRVVLPEAARQTLDDLGRLRIATPDGARVPLEEVAHLETGRGFSSLARVDGKRAVTVKASVDETRANVKEVTDDITQQFEDIGALFPGVTLTFEGRKKETAESLGSLAIGFPVAMLLIYCLLSAMFRSYVQPLLVMAAIPYAFVGAILGHLLMGLPFTLLSMIGGVALAGIVVNDSLILVDVVNRKRREEGVPALEAVVAGARARVRAILLTSITTVLGLAPLMLETSFQAQFLIPMAVSIVFGLMFATGVTLIVLPVLYMINEDLKAVLRWLFTGTWAPNAPEPATAVR